MKPIKSKSEKCKEQKEHKKYYRLGGPYYSRDNASWHQWADLGGIGINSEDLFPLPPYSPDMHKVIEHVVNNTWQRFQEYLLEHPSITTPAKVRAAFEHVFYTCNKVCSISQDIDSLPATYTVVHAKKEAGGTEGNWPCARYR